MSSSSIDLTPDRKQLVSFGFIMAAAALFFAWLHGRSAGYDALTLALLGVGTLFALAAIAAPRPLAPLYRRWMRLAEALSWFNTRLILVLVYYLIVTPIGLALRLARRAPLAIQEREGSFWVKTSKHSWGDKHFEKQF